MSGGQEQESPYRLGAAALLAAAGAIVAGYLAADQIGVVARVWDPVFGTHSSQAVLHSWLSRALPVPDAALGAASYVIELALAITLVAQTRGTPHPWLGLVYGALALGMAVAGAALVVVQAISVRSFCLLCLVSAALSWVVAALAFPTLTTAVRGLAGAATRKRRPT